MNNLKKLELPGLELVDSNADYNSTENIFIDFDEVNGTTYDRNAPNVYIDNIDTTVSLADEEKKFEILTNLSNTTEAFISVNTLTNGDYSTISGGNEDSIFSDDGSFSGYSGTINSGEKIEGSEAPAASSKISSIIQITETAAPIPTTLDTEVSGDIPGTVSSYGTTESNIFMLSENWGHEYLTAKSGDYYFADAEKHPGSSGESDYAGDDLLCWAGSASNTLKWAGWADNITETFDTEQDVFDYYTAHWTDNGSFAQWGWEWWMTGVEPEDSVAFKSAAHVNVEGAGFFSGSGVTVDSVIDVMSYKANGVYQYHNMWDFAVEHFDAG